MAQIIKVDGSKVEIQPENGTDFSLSELKRAIGGGHIEVVFLSDKELLVCDEEGKLKDLSCNPAATYVLQKHQIADTICGDALLCKREEIK